jgi:hypothetical protein
MKGLYNLLNEKIIDRYGLGVVIRKYGFYPSWLPITITGEHGPNLADFPADETLIRTSPFYFAYANRKKYWTNLGDKKLVRHPSPFVWYRRKKKVKRNPNASGTLFFYTHSTKLVKSQIDEDAFFQGLRSIPVEFQPITICLHFNSLEDRFTRKIEDNGFTWLSLGGSYNENLIRKFYEEVPKFKYAMGNNFTSGFLYCSELGIPCSILFTDGIRYTNGGNRKYKEKEWDLNNHPIEGWRTAMRIFQGLNATVKEDQIKFTEQELGLDLIDSLSNRFYIMLCLYVSLFYCFTKTSLGFFSAMFSKGKHAGEKKPKSSALNKIV